MGVKVAVSRATEGRLHGHLVHCPACGHAHIFDARWQYDGNEAAPTFAPSMLVRGGGQGSQYVCHSFLEKGVWRFLDDCTHAMRGQRVAAPDWPLRSPEMAETKPSDKNDKQADKPPAAAAAPAPPPPAPAPPPPPPPDMAATVAAQLGASPTPMAPPEQRAVDTEIRQRTALIFQAFQGPPFGLNAYSASLLCAHLVGTADPGLDIDKMGRSEAIAWAEGFSVHNPVCWFPLKNGDLNAFCKMLAIQGARAITCLLPDGRRTVDADAYRDLSAAIRS